MLSFELSSKSYKNGRRPFTASLYKLQPPENVVNNVGTTYNENGLTFLEEYAALQLNSIKDMSVRVEFTDDTKTEIAAHGFTGFQDGMPVFENATTIGHFTEGYIADVEVKGEMCRCVCGKGFIDQMAYPAFVAELENKLNNGYSVDGSIEIYKSEGNDGIIYLNGKSDETGRIPTDYIHSGWDFVLSPADQSSTLLELNDKKGVNETMDEKALGLITDSVKQTISEINDKSAQYETQIAELNSVIENSKKDAATLTAEIETLKATIATMEAERDTYWETRDALVKELGELKAAKKIAEMNEALKGFTEEQKDFAKAEIEAFTANPVESEINSITDKIYLEIGKQKVNTTLVEVNSVGGIFADIDDTKKVDGFSIYD